MTEEEPIGQKTIEIVSAERRGLDPHWILVAVIALAALLRFLYLGAESLWFDESISVAIAHQNWLGLWKAISHSEANMALYYALLHVWTGLGDSEYLIRSLSAAAGVLSVPVVYALGKRLLGTRPALIGAALLAANAFHVRYSQQARGYALAVLLVTLASLLFVQGIQKRSTGCWAAYVLVSTLAVYSHFFAILVLGAQWASIACLLAREVPWQKLLISIATISILLLPLAVFVLTTNGGQLDWVPKPSPIDMYYLFESLAGGGRILVIAYLAPCLVAVFLFIRALAHSGRSFDTWRYGMLLSWLFGPVLFVFAFSLWKPLFVDRFLLICVPAFVLLAAIGLSQIRTRWILITCICMMLVVSVRKLPWLGGYWENEDWRGASSYLISQASPRDGILFYSAYGRLSFDYYERRLRPGKQAPTVLFPDSLALDSTSRIDPDNSLLAALPSRCDKVWLFVRFNEGDPALQQRDHSIEDTLAREYVREDERRFRGVRVIRYSNEK